MMHTARGFVECDGGRFIGTFDIGGSPRYVAVDVKPLDLSFECKSATLTYGDVTQLDGNYNWAGTAGRDVLEMAFVGGVAIVGPLTTPRSSIRIRGAGSWSTAKPDLLPLPASSNALNVPGNFQSHNTVRDAAKDAREQQLIDLGLPIIVIFGESGVGKSTFINLIASEQQKVGRGLQSCTNEVSAIGAKVGGQPVVVIDTPGFDNTRAGMRDENVLTIIAEFLRNMAERKVYVTGVLILHRITDIAFSHTAYRIANMLKNLCGNAAMNNLIICTTMWDRVSEDEGHDIFDELCRTDAWREMISKGAGTAMISNVASNAKEEAERIITQLIRNAQPVELAIQDKMVNRKLNMSETSAFIDNGHRIWREEAECELEETRMRVCEESKTTAAEAQEVMRVREGEVAKVNGEPKNVRDDPACRFAPSDAVRDAAKVEREQRLLESGVPIIAIFGQSGVGKSTFINLIASEQQKVGASLQSCTSEISAIEAKIGGKTVVLIDTPGIDDTRIGVEESDVLLKIAKFLGDMGQSKVHVSGVLFLHSISVNKFTQTANRVTNMIKNLCGDVAMDHVTLCITMWDKVAEEEGYERYDELCEIEAWKEMISNGASTALISNVKPEAKAEAEKIVSELIHNAEPVELAIQDEIVNQKLTLGETGAGKLVDEGPDHLAQRGSGFFSWWRDWTFFWAH